MIASTGGETRTADEQPKSIGHDAQIGGDGDEVRRQKQGDGGVEEPGRAVPADIAGNSLAGGPAQSGADRLHDDHQGIHQGHQPAEPVPEARPGLGVGRDRGLIIVGGAADDAGPEELEEARLAQPFAQGLRADAPGVRLLECRSAHSKRPSPSVPVAGARERRRKSATWRRCRR
jgi:hypothetical protein